MQNITLTGIDLGKYSFHIHCQDKSGKALLRKKFTRTKLMQFLATCPPSVVVMEARAGAQLSLRVDCSADWQDMPSYGYRRVWGILRKQRRTEGLQPVNAKRLYRIMSSGYCMTNQSDRSVNTNAKSRRQKAICAGVQTVSGSAVTTVINSG